MSKSVNVFKRKLQKISNSYLVSLPIQFIRKHKLNQEKGLMVLIKIKPDWTLNISSDINLDKQKIGNEITIHAYREVAKEVVEKILSGIERITIISDKVIAEEIQSEIRFFVDGIPQAEIIEDEPQRMVVLNLGFKNLPTRNIIRRLLSIISNAFENIKENKIDKIERNMKELRKFYLILVGHIRTFHIIGVPDSNDESLTHKKASDYRLFSYQIKQIGKILEEIEINDQIMDYFLQVERYFNEIYNAFLKNDIKFAYKLWFKNRKLEEDGRNLANTLIGEDRYKTKDLLKIVNICRSMTALIYS